MTPRAIPREAVLAAFDNHECGGPDDIVCNGMNCLMLIHDAISAIPAWKPDVEAAFDADYKHCLASADVRVRAILRAAGVEVIMKESRDDHK